MVNMDAAIAEVKALARHDREEYEDCVRQDSGSLVIVDQFGREQARVTCVSKLRVILQTLDQPPEVLWSGKRLLVPDYRQ